MLFYISLQEVIKSALETRSYRAGKSQHKWLVLLSIMVIFFSIPLSQGILIQVLPGFHIFYIIIVIIIIIIIND
jgi:hypothetical protein